MLQVLRHTGLRVGELIGLRLADIELKERSGALAVRSGKGEKHRVVPLNISARRDLQSYLAVRPASKDDHLFLSRKGGALSPQAVQRMVAKFARRAELADVTPHVLRHSFAKDVLDRGESLTTVAARLGHQNIQTTAMYTQPSGRDLARAVDSIAEEDTK